MGKVRLLFNFNGAEFYEVGKENSKEFLSLAKEKGCNWFTGKQIKPEDDSCGRFMMISSKGYIGWIGLTCMAEVSRGYKESMKRCDEDKKALYEEKCK